MSILFIVDNRGVGLLWPEPMGIEEQDAPAALSAEEF